MLFKFVRNSAKIIDTEVGDKLDGQSPNNGRKVNHLNERLITGATVTPKRRFIARHKSIAFVSTIRADGHTLVCKDIR